MCTYVDGWRLDFYEFAWPYCPQRAWLMNDYLRVGLIKWECSRSMIDFDSVGHLEIYGSVSEGNKNTKIFFSCPIALSLSLSVVLSPNMTSSFSGRLNYSDRRCLWHFWSCFVFLVGSPTSLYTGKKVERSIDCSHMSSWTSRFARPFNSSRQPTSLQTNQPAHIQAE